MSTIALNYFTPKTEDKELVHLKSDKQPSLLQNDDFRSTSRHVKNFYRRHIIDVPRIKI